MAEFLSTPSARRATRHYFFSRKAADISIHALREEGDWKGHQLQEDRVIFLSTPSARRATTGHAVQLVSEVISIHALREEGDFCRGPAPRYAGQISIHALREEGDGIGFFEADGGI